MPNRIISFLFLAFLGILPAGQAFSAVSDAGKKRSPQEYVEQHKQDAIKEMQVSGVPASITMAQGMLESNNGNSDLAVYANNHFGIKCHEDWTGETFTKTDDTKDECFRKYTTVLESYNDHSVFLRSRARYAYLFCLSPTDYKSWAKGLKESGYATEPHYSDRLIELIEQNNLMELDQLGLLPPDKGVSASQRDSLAPTAATACPTVSEDKGNVIRGIQLISERQYVVAREGDSFSSLAKEYQKGEWELPRYNERERNARILPGQHVYLQPKRRKGNKLLHIVKSGETMYSISQDHCIKLKFLYKWNRLAPGAEPQVGDVIFLKRRR
jgi:LysM repeat protein